ncbi:hypothetical protein C0J52_06397, partial [Blattella germanica]
SIDGNSVILSSNYYKNTEKNNKKSFQIKSCLFCEMQIYIFYYSWWEDILFNTQKNNEVLFTAFNFNNVSTKSRPICHITSVLQLFWRVKKYYLLKASRDDNNLTYLYKNLVVNIMGFGSGSNAFNGFFWLLILLLFSWWIAALCFFPFVLVSVLTPCIDGFKNVHDLLLAGVMFPHKCSDNMVHRRSYDSF